ncbi:hypothetical protein F4167_18580 [Candidatus Poribacteria bacterium]|nr:hypothetical protein [Candidatus Poribacteria bacterium]
MLFQKIRDYMIQCYNRFETNVDAYLSSGTELIESNKELERIEDETLKEVDRINSRFRRKLDRAFPIESSYSFDIRYEMKEMTRQLSTRTLKPEEVFSQLDKSIRKLLRKWTRDLDDIIAEYLRYIKHEARERLHESGRTYRSSIPSNRNTELQAMPNFQSEFLQTYFLQTRWFPDYGRLIPSGIFPAYFAYTLMAAGATTPAAAAVFVLPAVAISLVIIGVLCWHNYEVRQKERGQQANVEGEKDMKIFNYYIAHTIRIEFEEIIFCSQDALRNIFKEIRKAERKRITIDNACPAIKAITEDSLLEKIRENRKAIESFSRW